MVTNISQEIIEIDGVEYTLFMNRKGIVSWENITKFTKKAQEIEKKYKKTSPIELEEGAEIEDGVNPFEFANADEIDQLEKDEMILRDIYEKFYWIALYENHKLSISQVKELFGKAEAEYGLDQLIALANQMIEDMNTNKFEPKKLMALKSTK